MMQLAAILPPFPIFLVIILVVILVLAVLVTSLPVTILLNSKRRLGRYCWIWAAIPFVSMVWALLHIDFERYSEDVPIYFIDYLAAWGIYLALYRVATRRRTLDIMPLVLKYHEPANREQNARGERR